MMEYNYFYCTRNFVLIVTSIIALCFNRFSSIHAQTEELIQTLQLPQLPYLRKCSAELNYTSLSLINAREKFLQIPYPNAKIKWFQNIYQNKELYNFPLKFSEELQCSQKFDLAISRDRDDSNPVWFFFTPDGFLVYNRDKTEDKPEEEIDINPKNYCIQSINNTHIHIQTCKTTCGTISDEISGRGLCINKCCTWGQVRDQNAKCIDVVDAWDWNPSIWTNLYGTEPLTGIHPNFQRAGDIPNWNCSSKQAVLWHSTEDFRIIDNGKIFWKKPGRENWFPMYPRSDHRNSNKFCVDGYWNTSAGPYDPKSFMFTVRCDLSERERKQLVNPLTDPDAIKLRNEITFHQIVLFVIMLITSLIYLFIMIVYGIIWKDQNVHGWTIFVFATSQFLYNFTRCVQSSIFAFGEPEVLITIRMRPLCVTIGLVLQFCIIASFAWTSVLTFDVWSKIRSVRAQSRTYKGHKRFATYLVGGFSVPIIWILISIIMEFGSGYEPHLDDDGLIRPGLRKYCEIDTISLSPYLIYVGLPIITLFLINMVLASSTVIFLCNAKQIKTKDSKSTSKDRNNLKLAMKLFVMMGIFLIVEAVQTFKNLSYYSVYWVFFELYRIFHAAGITWIFLANKKILGQIQKSIPSLKLHSKAKGTEDHSITTAGKSHTSSTAADAPLHP